MSDFQNVLSRPKPENTNPEARLKIDGLKIPGLILGIITGIIIARIVK